MRAAVLALLLAGAALCQAQPVNNATAGVVNVGSGGPATPVQLDNMWTVSQQESHYNRYWRTFLVGEVVIDKSNTTESDTECSYLCDDNVGCSTWAWCNDQNGCQVNDAACSTTAAVPFQTCILSSWENVIPAYADEDFGGPDGMNGTAMVGSSGSNVGFISGYFRSSPSAPAFTPPAGQGWWNNFTVERGVFYFLDEMSTPEAAASASDCAARCSTTEGCDAYNFCPMEATEGCLVPQFMCSSQLAVSAGFCMLGSTESEGPNTPFVKLDAITLPFISGARIPAAPTA